MYGVLLPEQPLPPVQGTNAVTVTFSAGFTGGNLTVATVNSCGTSSSRVGLYPQQTGYSRFHQRNPHRNLQRRRHELLDLTGDRSYRLFLECTQRYFGPIRCRHYVDRCERLSHICIRQPVCDRFRIYVETASTLRGPDCQTCCTVQHQRTYCGMRQSDQRRLLHRLRIRSDYVIGGSIRSYHRIRCRYEFHPRQFRCEWRYRKRQCR